MLTQTTHRKIRRIFPENLDGFILYDGPCNSIIYDPDATGSVKLRVRFEVEELVDKERPVDVALRHDLDLDLLPPKQPKVPEFAREFCGFSTEEYTQHPFGFMTDLPDKLYERDKRMQEFYCSIIPQKKSCSCKPIDLSRFNEEEQE